MNATNEESEGANITIIPTDNANPLPGNIFVECDGIVYSLMIGKSTDDSGEQTISFNPADPQAPIYLDQINLTPSFGGEVLQVEVPSADHSDLIQPPPTIIQEEESYAGLVKVDENHIVDYRAISSAKLGTLTSSLDFEGTVLSHAASVSTSHLSLSDISIKLPKVLENPEALLSADIITHNLGNLSKVRLGVPKVDIDASAVLPPVEVVTYLSPSDSAELVHCEGLPNFSWNNFIIPGNVLLVRHPLIRFRPEERFADRHCLFPTNTELQARSLISGVISHSPDGLLVNNRTVGPIDQYFIEPNSSSEEMHQNQDHGGTESRGGIRNEQLQIQLFQMQRPNSGAQHVVTNSSSEYVLDHTKWLYAIQPKGSSSSQIIIVQSEPAESVVQSTPQSHGIASLATTSSPASSSSNVEVQLPQLGSKSIMGNTKQKGKPSRKSVPKTKCPPKQKQTRKSKNNESATTTTAIQPVPEHSNNLTSSVNGFTSNCNQSIGNDSSTTTTVLLSSVGPDGILSSHSVQCRPSSSNYTELPQQYFIMSPPNYPSIQAATLQSNNANHPMMVGSIHNSASIQVLPASNRINQTYQQPATVQQTQFSMISNEQVSSPTNNQLIGTVAGGLGSISKLGNGNIVVQVPSSSNSPSMIVRNSAGPGEPRPPMLPVFPHNHTSLVRQPMFTPIEVNNYQYNKGNAGSGSSANIKTYSPTTPIQQQPVYGAQYSTSVPISKVKLLVEPKATAPEPSHNTLSPSITPHSRKTNPAHNYHPLRLAESLTMTYLPHGSPPVKDIQTKGMVEEPGHGPFTRERFIGGHEALCGHCGTRSQDLHYCEYCKTRISNEAKLVPIPFDPNSKNNNIEPKNYNIPLTPVQQLATESVKKQTKKPTVPRKSKGGGKRQEELIVLSSSEDEDQPKSKVPKPDQTDNVQSSESNSPAFGGGGVGKELKINLSLPSCSSASASASTTPLSQRRSTYIVHDDEMDFDKLIEEIQESLNSAAKHAVKVECRSIRVGDYKCSGPSPLGTDIYPVVFSERGIMFTLPHAQIRHKAVACALPIDNILIVEANYKKTLPVIFLATGPRLAKHLRKLLGLSDDPKDQGNHYGPQDGDKCQKRIVFLFTTINDQAAATINKIFGRTLSEIDSTKANQILCDITRDPHANSSASKKLVIGTSKLPENPLNASVSISVQKPANTNSTELQQPPSSQIDVSKNKKLLCYSEIDILQQDVLCLADEQFLNDSILDFWLRYVEHEILPPEAKDRTYMFSTFFYKRLTTRPKKRNSLIEDDPNITASEKRHNRVKRWTKNVDIFDKDFLIIPINESLHWFLAVICFPGLQGVHDITTGEPLPDYQKSKKKPLKTKTATSKIGPVSNGLANSDSGDGTSDPSISTNSPSDGTQSQESQDGLTDQSKTVQIKQPCILVFDSLAGDNRGRVYSTLREYLKMEYKTRKGEDREFTKMSMPGGMPKVPQQPNHCDCGIYTLFYVECFFKWPMKTFDMTSDDYYAVWASQSSCSTKREDIYKSVKELVKKTNPDALPLIPILTFNPLPPTPSRACLLKQIESAPVSKLEKLLDGQEPMDIDVDSTRPTAEPQLEQPSISKPILPSTVESDIIRASPADNDHDHDYARVPNTTTH